MLKKTVVHFCFDFKITENGLWSTDMTLTFLNGNDQRCITFIDNQSKRDRIKGNYTTAIEESETSQSLKLTFIINTIHIVVDQ